MNTLTKAELVKLFQRTIDHEDPDRQYIGFLADKVIELVDKQIIEELGRIYQNASYAEDRTAKEVIDRLESRLTQLRTTK